MTIIIRSVFEEDGELYPHFFFRRHFVWNIKMLQDKKLTFKKELTLLKQIRQKIVCFVIIGTLKMLDLILNHISVINVKIY